MAADRQRHLLGGFIVLLCAISGVFGAITRSPENVLLVLCEDETVTMDCTSTESNEITWTYDGNTVISGACQPVHKDDIFMGNPSDAGKSCRLVASQRNAWNDSRIQTVSGPYGCTDRASLGVTATAMTVVLDMWCGIIDPCVPIEHKDVTIGCFASFDWLSFLLQYNPIVRINTTLQWINDSSSVRDHIQLRVPFREERGPPSHTLTTTTTFTNVQPGDIITAECRVDIGFFLRDDSSISPRNSYETNPLYHVCTVNQTVRYCPVNVTIDPECLVGRYLKCGARSYPEPYYFWIDHLHNDTMIFGSEIQLTEPGPFYYTCVAYNNVTCEMNKTRPFCQERSSLWFDEYQSDIDFPYSLFNESTISFLYGYIEENCTDKMSIYGIAFECPNMTMEALNVSVCWNNSEVVLLEPSNVTFDCTFENLGIGVTYYRWVLDGEEKYSGYNMSIANIEILSGSHQVTCHASINIADFEGIEKLTPEQIAECQCNETRTIYATVIECVDNVTITPRDDCVQQYTDFTCLATHGHEIGPYYTYYIDPPNGNPYHKSEMSPMWSFTHRVQHLGWYNLTCEAKYTHEYCPEYYAICNDSITFQVFECPNITLYGNSSSECLETRYIYDEIVLLQRDVVDFHCVYELVGTTTMYTWYVDGTKQNVTTNTFRYDFTSTTAYDAYVVECRGMIFVDANCNCNSARTINVTIIVCEDPTLQPQDLCVEEGTNYTCMATWGYPPPPYYDFYYWHHEDTSVLYSVSNDLTPPSHAVYRIGNFSVSCCVNYSHPVYPECYAKCCANTTSSIVQCPNITLYGNSSCVQTSDEMILVGRSVVGFYCDYEMDGATTIYSWYIDDVEQPGFAGKTFQHDFATTNTAYTYVVKCGGRIEVTDNWFCSENRTMNVTIVDCHDPILEPPGLCVSPGTNYTCMATSGYPPPPTYDFYWHHEDGGVADYTIRSSLTPPSYAVHRIGNFSVSCCVDYAHPVYPECYATCCANTTAIVFVCPESIWLWHNATNATDPSYPKLSTEYNRPLSFNKTIAIEFECIYEPEFYHITTFEWTVTESDDGILLQTQGNDRFLQYFFEETGDYVVKCMAWFDIEICEQRCKNMTDVPITIYVPKNETCTCPCLHWPPVIPPIFAILISILMIPCYCYSCGPWSGPYWAEERRKHQPRQLCSRPTATNAYNAGARFRPLTNGYGAF